MMRIDLVGFYRDARRAWAKPAGARDALERLEATQSRALAPLAWGLATPLWPVTEDARVAMLAQLQAAVYAYRAYDPLGEVQA